MGNFPPFYFYNLVKLSTYYMKDGENKSGFLIGMIPTPQMECTVC